MHLAPRRTMRLLSRLLRISRTGTVLQGVLCLLVPFYVLYYIATHWEETKAAAGILAVSIIASVVGNVLLVSVISTLS